MPKKTLLESHFGEDKKINKIVRELRMKLGLTQADVAERLGMITTTYSQMEREGNIPAHRINQLAEIFQVEPSYLLGVEIPKFEQPTVTIPIPEPMDLVLTNREKNSIEMIRRMKPEDREEVFRIIKEMHDKKFNKK